MSCAAPIFHLQGVCPECCEPLRLDPEHRLRPDEVCICLGCETVLVAGVDLQWRVKGQPYKPEVVEWTKVVRAAVARTGAARRVLMARALLGRPYGNAYVTSMPYRL